MPPSLSRTQVWAPRGPRWHRLLTTPVVWLLWFQVWDARGNGKARGSHHRVPRSLKFPAALPSPVS